MQKRPSKDRYYLNIAGEVAKRSTCLNVRIGAVIIRDDQIISTGYVGAPRGTRDSLERGFCLRRKLGIPSGQRYELCRSVHAEQNAIINAARAGVSLLGGDLYIHGMRQNDRYLNAFPCFICKKMIINSGLNRAIITTEEGDMKIFSVADWVKEWQEGDLLDDKDIYGVAYSHDCDSCESHALSETSVKIQKKATKS